MDLFKADLFPSPSVPPTITQTTSRTQVRVSLRCEIEARVLRGDTEFGVPIFDFSGSIRLMIEDLGVVPKRTATGD
jgi:hypothetical protein